MITDIITLVSRKGAVLGGPACLPYSISSDIKETCQWLLLGNSTRNLRKCGLDERKFLLFILFYTFDLIRFLLNDFLNEYLACSGTKRFFCKTNWFSIQKPILIAFSFGNFP